MFDWICICQTIFSFLDKNHLEWVWVVIRVVSKPGFLWNQINHGRHNIFWSFRSKGLQKVKKRFQTLNLHGFLIFLTVCNAFDLNDQKILCLPWFIWFQRKPGFETALMTTHTHSKWFLSRNEKSVRQQVFFVWQIQIQSKNNDF